MAALTIEGLTVDYARPRGGALRVLDAVSLEVASGEFFSLIGPSGCGKTTLLNAILGLVTASAGRIEKGAARCAMVFQRPTLMPWRTALENALFGLECRGRLEASARSEAAALLEGMRLGGHLESLPHELSEGMKQRVNLARALLTRPDILLMDEPFSALDVGTRRALQDDLLATWEARELTVVLVSHSLEEVVYMSDRVGVLSEKPSRLVALSEITLPRPRGETPAGMLALYEQAQALSTALAPPRG